MHIRDRIISLLRERIDGCDDDELATQLGLSRGQQANARCRDLAREGLVERRPVQGKISNFLIGGQIGQPAMTAPVPPSTIEGKSWCWEGNVVLALTSHLTAKGWTIEAVANTATGEPGVDIKASRVDRVLLVEVKGTPRNSMSEA